MKTKKEKRKLEITLKTYDILIEKGVTNFSLNNLLETISMSKGNFYHYFKNKDELFYETLKIAYENIYIKYKSIKTINSFKEKLHDLFFLYLSKEKEVVQYLWLVNQMYYLFSNEKNNYLYNFMQETYSSLFKQLELIINDEIINNQIKKEATLIIKPLVATVDGMLTHSFMLKNYDLQKELKKYLEFISEQYKKD